MTRPANNVDVGPSPRAVALIRRLLLVGEWLALDVILEVAGRAGIEPSDVFGALAVLPVDVRPVADRRWEVALRHEDLEVPPAPDVAVYEHPAHPLLGSAAKQARPNRYPGLA